MQRAVEAHKQMSWHANRLHTNSQAGHVAMRPEGHLQTLLLRLRQQGNAKMQYGQNGVRTQAGPGRPRERAGPDHSSSGACRFRNPSRQPPNLPRSDRELIDMCDVNSPKTSRQARALALICQLAGLERIASVQQLHEATAFGHRASSDWPVA